MTELNFESNATPEILIEAHSTLVVHGWDKNEVQAKSKAEDGLTASQEGDRFTIRATQPATLSVPNQAVITIESAQDKLVVKDVLGAVKIIEGTSALVLKNVGPVNVESADGSLTLKNVQGDVHIRYCSGMLTASGVSGDFLVELVDGHLTLKNMSGNIHAETSGNANLKLDPPAGKEININAQGVLSCKVPNTLNAVVALEGQGPVLVNAGGVSKRSLGGDALTLTFGEGAAAMNLSARGPVSLLGGAEETESTYEFNVEFDELNGEFGSIASDIASQVNQQLESHLHILDAQLENLTDMAGNWPGISPEKAEKIAQRAQEKAERAREKIQRASERAQARIAQKIAAAQRRETRKVERAARSRSINVSFGSRQPAKEPVSDAERMLILNMLAEKKISAEEADKLLAALEANE